jgi:calcineurin-like phosphoesterase family protein
MENHRPETYFAGDPLFGLKTAAAAQGMDVDKYNQMVIDKINSVVCPDDFIIFMGDLGEVNEELLSKINGRCQCFYSSNITDYKGFDRALGADGYDRLVTQYGTIYTYYPISKARFEIVYNERKDWENFYFAVPGSYLDTQFDGTYSKPILDISLSKWDFLPIKGSEMCRICDDFELFNKMENSEEVLDGTAL